jgi:hypothetical protein
LTSSESLSQFCNSTATQYQTVMYSMGINRNANTFPNVLLTSCLDNRDTVMQSTRIVLREILETYPEAFGSAGKPSTTGGGP